MELIDLKEKHEVVYREWVEHYERHAEEEFNSLIKYKTMVYEVHYEEEFKGVDFNSYIIDEIKNQIIMDKEQGYFGGW